MVNSIIVAWIHIWLLYFRTPRLLKKSTLISKMKPWSNWISQNGTSRQRWTSGIEL